MKIIIHLLCTFIYLNQPTNSVDVMTQKTANLSMTNEKISNEHGLHNTSVRALGRCIYHKDIETAVELFMNLSERSRIPQHSIDKLIELFITNCSISKLSEITLKIPFRHKIPLRIKNYLQQALTSQQLKQEDIETMIHTYVVDLLQNDAVRSVVMFLKEVIDSKLPIDIATIKIFLQWIIKLKKRDINQTQPISDLRHILKKISYFIYCKTITHFAYIAKKPEFKELIQLDVMATIELYSMNDKNVIFEKLDKWCTRRPVTWQKSMSWILLLPHYQTFDGTQTEQKFNLVGFENEHLLYLLVYICQYKSEAINQNLNIKLLFSPDQQTQIEKSLQAMLANTKDLAVLVNILLSSHELPLSSSLDWYIEAANYRIPNSELRILETLLMNCKDILWETVTEKQLLQLFTPMIAITTNPNSLYQTIVRVFQRWLHMYHEPILTNSPSGQEILYLLRNRKKD